jgi:uncharacterized protein YkwD
MNSNAINPASRRLIRSGALAVTLLLLQMVFSTVVLAAPPERSGRETGSTMTRSTRAASAPCADANLVPTSGNIQQIDAATLCLINQQRALHGERSLRNNADLTHAATHHSQDMVAEDYFDHTSPTGKTLLDRIRASGYLRHRWSYELGENIAAATLWLATPAEIVSAWMQSPPHRANILDSDFVASGIGVVATVPAKYSDGEDGATYTEDFGVVEAR